MKTPHTIISTILEKYLIGCAVKAVLIRDPYRQIPTGTKGIVTFVDATGTVFVEWQNGVSLGVIHGIDKIERISSIDHSAICTSWYLSLRFIRSAYYGLRRPLARTFRATITEK